VTRSGVLWKRREAIRKGYDAAFRGALKGSRLKIRVLGVRFLTSRSAIVQCAVELSEKTGKRMRKVRAATRFAMRTNRGRWEITAARTREKPARVRD
jgi:uncharacterized protein (TIGR02246 family)